MPVFVKLVLDEEAYKEIVFNYQYSHLLSNGGTEGRPKGSNPGGELWFHQDCEEAA
jgi:hypothetical protein